MSEADDSAAGVTGVEVANRIASTRAQPVSPAHGVRLVHDQIHISRRGPRFVNAERPTNGGLQIILCVQFDRRAAPTDVSIVKSALVESGNCIHSVDVTGAFDLIAEFAAPGIGWYKSWMADLAGPLARGVSRYEANFVFGRSVRRAIDEDAVWVREGGGFKRIDSELIDKVTAEGDYVRIHSRGDSWLVHDTMKSVGRRLTAPHFIRIHRSTIVRLQSIHRVTREDRHWVAHLADGTAEPVASSHAAETLEMIRSSRSTVAEVAGRGKVSEDLRLLAC